jgi:cobalt-zinc-cadmium efflux system outer membrane protein
MPRVRLAPWAWPVGGSTVKSHLVVAAIFAVACTEARALGATPPLRWQEVVSELDRNPRFREASLRASAARAGIDAVGQVPNPKLEVTAGEGWTADGSLRKTEWALGITVPLEWLGTRGPRVDAARAAASEADEESALVRQEVLLRLRRLFVLVAHDERLVESLAASSKQADDLARLVRLRVERGEARPPELPRVEVEAERSRLAMAHASSRAMVHRDQLSLWVGRPVEHVAIDMAQAPEPPALADVRERVASEQPRVRAARDRVAAAAAEARAERSQRFPAISLSGYALSEVDRSAVGGGLGVEFPVWNWNSGKIAQTEAIQAAEEARLLVANHEARAALVDSWAMCTQGRLASRRLREEVVPRAESAAAKMDRSYQLGESPLFETLDSRRALLEVRRELLAAELEQQLECSTLTILAGGDLR